ncbi:MAG: hypothetical protein OXN18_02295 [Gemmatimonadota bacterium]|nr:hypothetical protein [Gemmatimonadota bacterium]
MFRARSRLLTVSLAGVFLVAGCGDEMVVVPDPMPPDLTGTYALQSFTSALDPETTLVPPEVSGSFTVQQTAVVGGEATGTFTSDLTLPFSGNIVELPGTGTYVNRLDGTWEQEFLTGPLVQLSPQQTGTYTFENSVLTVVVTQPPLSASTTVWRRQ